LVLQDEYRKKFCKLCGEKYTDVNNKWCKPCFMDKIESAFTSWTSGNKEIDHFIQEMQLKVNTFNDTLLLFEWISYNQFTNIKEIGKDNLATIYIATWKDSPMKTEKYIKLSDEQVALKYLYNPQNETNNEFSNEVWEI